MTDEWEPPERCHHCGARPRDLATRTRADWAASLLAICPRCARRFYAARGHVTGLPRCAGCGRRVHTLFAGVCGDCRSIGIEAPQLDLGGY